MSLPVDPQRLRATFPALTDADLEAYVAVTRRILGEGETARRARVTREVLARGQDARAKERAGVALDVEDRLALGYLAAVEKMQRSTTTRGRRS